MPNEAPRQPDHRHLRRAAEALSGRDDDQHVWVAVQLSERVVPFGCKVFDSQADADNFAVTNSTEANPWRVIACHSEPPELQSGTESRFFALVHDETSPLKPLYLPLVDRNEIQEMRLVLRLNDGQEYELNLTAHLTRDTQINVSRPNPTVDAIFLTLEAMDKYVFPNLVQTYGTRGANNFRERIMRDLERQGSEGEDAPHWNPHV